MRQGRATTELRSCRRKERSGFLQLIILERSSFYQREEDGSSLLLLLKKPDISILVRIGHFYFGLTPYPQQVLIDFSSIFGYYSTAFIYLNRLAGGFPWAR
jgi:hypothetical protein